MANPEVRFFVGDCSASVFVSTIQTAQGPKSVSNVRLQRVYQDGDNKPQWTSSLRLNDIPKGLLALQRAYEYLISKEVPRAVPPPSADRPAAPRTDNRPRVDQGKPDAIVPDEPGVSFYN